MTHQAGEPETGGEKMLLKITDGQALDERKLMDVYAESNLENTDFFCPEEPDKVRLSAWWSPDFWTI